MTQLDKAFNAFKSDPTPANAWALQVAMVEYQQSIAPTKSDPEKQKSSQKRKHPELKTRKGGVWDTRLKEILELFAAFDWEVVPYKSNQYLEAWKVTDVNLDQAILYLSSDGFSMGGKKPSESLNGCFEGYEDRDRFDDFLSANDIEID